MCLVSEKYFICLATAYTTDGLQRWQIDNTFINLPTALRCPRIIQSLDASDYPVKHTSGSLAYPSNGFVSVFCFMYILWYNHYLHYKYYKILYTCVYKARYSQFFSSILYVTPLQKRPTRFDLWSFNNYNLDDLE